MDRERKVNFEGGVPLWATPCGVCPACGRYTFELHNAEHTCFWCRAANFEHRRNFTWAWCACRWEDPYCATCFGKGVVPIRKPHEIAHK